MATQHAGPRSNDRGHALTEGHIAWSDVAQLALSVTLGISLVLPSYGTASSNPHSNIDGKRGDLTGWAVHPVLRWVLLGPAVCGVLGAWQTVRVQKTELPRGELTVILAPVVVVLLVGCGLLDRPGAPSSTISLEYGWFLALGGSLGAIGTGLVRLARSRR
jgi:hypothetical protein